MTLRIGVVGLGMMGRTHTDVYAKHAGVTVAAVADQNPDRLAGRERAGGNIEGQAAGGFDVASPDVAKFDDALAMIGSGQIDAVDICAPTPAHLPLVEAALAAGLHVFVEKPPARTAADADRLAELAEKSGKIVQVGLCMRYWPGWTHLKGWHDSGEFGRLVSASFARIGAFPPGEFYRDAEASGAALLDLHLHDADFIRHLCGEPAAVSAIGASRLTSGVDHVACLYHYDGGPAVSAEGGWAMQDGYPFTMRYLANFERATAIFHLGAPAPLTLVRDGRAEPVTLDGMGYAAELDEWVTAIRENRPPRTATPADAAKSVRLIEAEARSIADGGRRTAFEPA